MWRQLKNRNFWLVLAMDSALAALCYYAAYLIRFEAGIYSPYLEGLISTMAWVVLVKVSALFVFGVYKGMWRYTSVLDIRKILTATVVSTTLIVSALVILYRFEGFPRSVFIIDFLLFFLSLSGFRMAIRLHYQKSDKHFFSYFHGEKGKAPPKRLLIIGAGDAGEKFLREIHDNPRLGYKAVGFVDDASHKTGRTIHGVTVLGATDTLLIQSEEADVTELVIAIPSATGEQMRRIVAMCEKTGKPFRTLPGLGELIDGRVSVKALRDVNYEDLLSRPVTQLDRTGIKDYLKGRSVLVTGGGGSIGSELCRQIARYDPNRIIVYEIAESALYDIELDLKLRFPGVLVEPVLGDVRDAYQLSHVFKQFSPEVVFHAAAYKHVPMLERHPWKAVETNIDGTNNVVNAAAQFKVKRFVFVSTDKAVRPSSVMGATKRVAEILVQGQIDDRHGGVTKFMTVRFGNVVGSVGSVVPLFQKQIARGGPVTVTHPEMTRYFMTIPEACQLILQAGAMGEGCEIFILDMGEPVRILDMARDLIQLSGLRPEKDIKIEFVGLRPGEKLFEELITEGEGISNTAHEQIMVIRGCVHDQDAHNQQIAALKSLAVLQDGEGIRHKLKEIVPEYLIYNGESANNTKN